MNFKRSIAILTLVLAAGFNLGAQAKKPINENIKLNPQTKGTIKLQSEKIDEVKETEGSKETVVLMKTEKGDIRIKLFTKEAPLTAGNFQDLVEKKFYNGIIFHRIIPGFVIQGGCPNGDGTGGYIDPKTGKERNVAYEKNDLKHDREGRVAMARTRDPNSASTQFFIDLEPQPGLNPGGYDPYGYVTFGQVIEGMEVVHKIAAENVPPRPGSDGTSNPVKILSASVEK